MKKSETIVMVLRDNPQGITKEEFGYWGLTYQGFHTRKSQINDNKKKYKQIQIIREGKINHSIWRLAETSPKATIAYGTKRASKGIRNFINRKEANNIALASEENAKKRLLLAAQLNQEAQKLAEVMYAMI